MAGDLFVLLGISVCLAAVLAIIGYPIWMLVRPGGVSGQFRVLSMVITEAVHLKNGDMILLPRWPSILVELFGGVVLLGISCVFVTGILDATLDIFARLTILITLIFLAGMGLGVLTLAFHGLSQPHVSFSAANRTVALHERGRQGLQTYTLSNVKDVVSEPLRGNIVRLALIGTRLFRALMGDPNSLFAPSNTLIDAGWLQISLQMNDASLVMIAIIPSIYLGDLSRDLEKVLAAAR